MEFNDRRKSKQFTHTVKAKDGSWSGSVTPMGASSAAHAKAIIEQGGKYEVTTHKDGGR
jgi:hypothetical protein